MVRNDYVHMGKEGNATPACGINFLIKGLLGSAGLPATSTCLSFEKGVLIPLIPLSSHHFRALRVRTAAVLCSGKHLLALTLSITTYLLALCQSEYFLSPSRDHRYYLTSVSPASFYSQYKYSCATSRLLFCLRICSLLLSTVH